MTATVGKKFRKELQYSQLSRMIVSPLPTRWPDHDGRIALRLHEDVCQHRGRGRLAVRTGHADGVFVGLHDIAPGLRALKNGNALGAGRGDLRIVIVRSGRADQAVGVPDVFGPVANGDGNALGDQLVRGDGRVHVRAGDLHAHAPQHKPQRPHRHAADADQMTVLAGLEIVFNMITGSMFHVRFPQKSDCKRVHSRL